MSQYEKLDFDSELLQKMREETEKILNRALLIAVKTEKESEITLKINVGKIEKTDKKETWIEPRLEYQIAEKIKETKSSTKGLTGYDYQLRIDSENNLYVQKINEQMEIGG